MASSINLANLDGTNGFQFGGSAGRITEIIGDVNGDGFDDVAVADAGAANGGVTYIIYGSSDPFDAEITPLTVDVTISGGVAGIQSGYSIAGVGDFNGDGVDDFLIGAPTASPDGRTKAGESYLVFGVDDEDGGLPAEIDLSQLDGTDGFVLKGETGQTGSRGDDDYRPPDLSGFAVSGADVNGDGLADLLIGAPQGAGTDISTDPDKSFSGLAYVVYGTTDAVGPALELSSLDGSNGYKIVGQVPGGGVGASIAGAGDLNNDGLEEIIVGAPQNGFGFTTGSDATPTYSYIIYGSQTSPTSIDLTTPGSQTGDVVILTGEQDSTQRGVAVSAAGDVNGDGYDDIIAGTWPGGNAASIVFGGPGILPSTIDLEQLDGTNGFSVATGQNGFITPWLSAAGDVNDDGFDDILVGVPQANPFPDAPGSEGTAYLIFGTDQGFQALIDPTELDGTDGLIVDMGGDTPSDALGISVSGGGDINGDGIADFTVAAIGDGQNSPVSFVVFGNDDLGEEVGFTFVGDEEDDVFIGKGSSDRAFGGDGKDLLIGREDDDFLFGGDDNDILEGGRDDDVLRGGLGRDIKKGGSGDDTYIGTAEELDGDRLVGFGRGDELIIEGYDGEVEIESGWFGRTEILFDTDENGSLDGSLHVKGVFGRSSFEVDQASGDTIISLDEQGPFGSRFSGFFEKLSDGWDFF